MDVQAVNTTWFKSPGDVFVTSGDSERLVFARTTNSRSGLYSRWQHIRRVGDCATGDHKLVVTYSFGLFSARCSVNAKFHYAIQIAHQLVRELVCDLVATC